MLENYNNSKMKQYDDAQWFLNRTSLNISTDNISYADTTKFENSVRNFDRADNAINGLYASKLVTHDIVKKKITQYDFNNYQIGNSRRDDLSLFGFSIA